MSESGRLHGLSRTLPTLALAIPAVLLFVGFVAYPIADALSLSLQRWNLIGPREPAGLANFGLVASDPVFIQALGNNLVIALVGPIVQTTLALIIAALIMQVSTGRTLYRTFLYSPVVIALVGVGLIWSFIFSPGFGLLNAALEAVGLGGLTRVWLGDPDTALPAVLAVSIWRWTGFSVVIFLAGLQGIRPELYEAAAMDGASRVRSFFAITVPLVAPFTFVNLVINVIGYLRFFDVVWVTTGGGPSHATETLATYIYTQAFRFFDIGRAAAATVILMALTVVVVTITLLVARRAALATEEPAE